MRSTSANWALANINKKALTLRLIGDPDPIDELHIIQRLVPRDSNCAQLKSVRRHNVAVRKDVIYNHIFRLSKFFIANCGMRAE